MEADGCQSPPDVCFDVTKNLHKPLKPKVTIGVSLDARHETAVPGEAFMFHLLKVLPLALVIVAIAIFSASCGSSSSKVQYRVVQTIPDAPGNIDISIGGKIVFTNIAFGSTVPVSGYSSVSSGSDPLEAFLTGTTTPVINSTNLNLLGGSQSTTVLTGLYAAPTAVSFQDDNSAPLSGQAELRIIDGSPSAPSNLDIYLVLPGTDITPIKPVISPLSFEHASQYVSLSVQKSGLVDVVMIVTATGDKAPLANRTYTLADGQIRSLVLVDVSPLGGALSFIPLELNDLN